MTVELVLNNCSSHYSQNIQLCAIIGPLVRSVRKLQVHALFLLTLSTRRVRLGRGKSSVIQGLGSCLLSVHTTASMKGPKLTRSKGWLSFPSVSENTCNIGK